MSIRTLLLLRHAKSDWSDGTQPDIDRPLNARGNEAAIKIARHLIQQKWHPQATHCSSALRTRETLSQLEAECKKKSLPLLNTIFKPELYLANPQTLLESIQHEASTSKTLLLIAHNPGIAALAHKLVHPAHHLDPGYLHLTQKFPTAALAVIQFNNATDTHSWKKTQAETGDLITFITPKQLDDEGNMI